MPKKFQTAIDLQKLELQNARVQNLASPPAGPVEGQIYYDSVLHQFGYYNGTTWIYGSTAPDATTSVKGIVQLTNDLSGTATAPVVNHFTLTSDSNAGSHRITNLTGLDFVASTASSGGVTFGGNEFQFYRSAAGALTLGNGGVAAKLAIDPVTATAPAILTLTGRSGGSPGLVTLQVGASGALSVAAATMSTVSFATNTVLVGDTSAVPALTVDSGNIGAATSPALNLVGRTIGGVANTASLSTSGTTGTLNITVPAGQVISLVNAPRIIGCADPLAAQDVATKNYVDQIAVAGVTWKAPVLVATTGAESYTIAAGACTQITGTTVDGISPAVNDRILVKNAPAATGAGSGTAPTSSTQPANGIYVVTNATTNLTISRATDADTAAEIQNAAVIAERGTNAEATWVISTDPPITINTTALTWVYTGGNAIQGDNVYITRSTNTIQPVATPADPTAGANGSVVATAPAHAKVMRFAIKGDGTTTVFTCTHSFGNRAVWAIGFQDSAGTPAAPVELDYASSSTSAIAVTFPAAPTAGQIFYVEVVG